MVAACIEGSTGTRYLTVHRDTVKQTRVRAVVQKRYHELQRQRVIVGNLHTIVCPADLRIVTNLVLVVARHLCLRITLALGQVFRLQTTEGLRYHRLRALRVEVAHEDKRHVVGHIPCVVEINQFAQTWVLQVLGQTNHIALVGAAGVQLAEQLLTDMRLHIVLVHVVLLKHILQLRLESTEDGVNQTVGEDGQPLVHVRRGERVVVASHVVRREGIHTRGADTVHQDEEVLASSILRCLN